MAASDGSMATRSWLQIAGDWVHRTRAADPPRVRIGLALGGGFARGITHLGVLRTLQRHNVPVSAIAGVSAGSIVAAAYASGATLEDIEKVARNMRFKDVARWTVSRFGLAETDRLVVFLTRLLKTCRFESMTIPLAVVASDLMSGQPAIFRNSGDVCMAVRASCAYPGLFLPVRHEGRYLVDGLVSMEVPAAPLRAMGVTHVISVALPPPEASDPRSVMCVVSRCFTILSARTQHEWRRYSSLVIEPDVSDVGWDSFASYGKLIEAGDRATEAAMPSILKWFRRPDLAPAAAPGSIVPEKSAA